MRTKQWYRRGLMDRLRRAPRTAGFVAATVVAPLALAVTTVSPATAGPPKPPKAYVGTPVVGAHAAHPPAPAQLKGPAAFTPTRITWPAAKTGTLALPAAATGGRGATAKTYAAGTPVWSQRLAVGGPTGMTVRVLDHATAQRAGVNGVLFTATPTGTGPVRVGFDYSSFAQSYGGNYGSRLRLVRLPACALTSPHDPACQTRTPLASANDPVTQSVSAQLTVGGQQSPLFAVVPDTSSGDGGGPSGTFSATTLKPSGSWSAGGSTGSFRYSYPIKVPPAASSLVPTVDLSYDSGSVDGQTAATQSQADWLGDGWSTPENYVEQSFVSCADSPEGKAAPNPTADMCYDGPILTLSLNGTTTSLVCAASCTTPGAVWKPQDDHGEVVTHQVGTGNGTGAYNTDYWTVTDRTGTVFSFGRNQLPGWASGKATTNSVQTQPVYGAQSGDPCYKATWSLSWCTMAYRWNLDYVKDLHGNAMAYYYKQDSNAYAQNANTTSAASYVRDAHLDHIDYGFADGNAYGTVSDKVAYTTGDRCVKAPCDPLSGNTANWPDVPYDLNCAAKATCYVAGPSYWSTVALTGITTKQYNGSTYVPVDEYDLKQMIPDVTVGSAQTLFLQSITHKGLDASAGGVEADDLPVTFTPQLLTNRTDASNGQGSLSRERIQSITTETGSVIGVNYELAKPCATPVTLTPATNTSSCFPVYWTPASSTTTPPLILDWFNKWAVQSVTQSDPSGGSGGLATSYLYVTGAAWHFDDNEVVQAKYRTYGQFRGYGDVQTFTGQGADPLTETETTYYRGMSLNNNTTAVTLRDSQGGIHDDANQLAGNALETTSYNFAGGPITGSTINSYWVSAASLSRTRTQTGLPALTANATGQVEAWTRQALTDTATTTWRTTETDTTYDADPAHLTLGLPTVVYAHGDLALSGNNQRRCTVTTYAPVNQALNLVGLTAEVETDALACGGANPQGATAPTPSQTNALTAPATVNRATDTVSDQRTVYDLQPLGATTEPSTTPTWPQVAPTRGDVSETLAAAGVSGNAFTYQVKAASTYDSYGRVLDTWDPLGHRTQAVMTMTNGVNTSVKSTNALGQSTTIAFDPYRGLPVTSTDANGVATTVHYDGLGRTIAVWRGNRATGTKPNDQYSYAIGTSTTPTVITTQVLNNTGTGTNTSITLYDALLRVRQTKAPTAQGGHLVTDTFYDTHGWVTKKNTNYWDTSTIPDGTLVAIADSATGNFDQDRIAYDGAGRPVEDQSYNQGVLVTTGYVVYYGDRTVAVPPAGTGAGGAASQGTVTATVVDALGRTSELDQYTTRPAVGVTSSGGITTVTLTGTGTGYQATTYTYDNAGQVSDVKDTAGTDWGTGYNLLGQATAKNDPDAGASAMTYDAAGNLKTTTDALGHTLTYNYDALNRKTSEYEGSTQLYSWVYDNANNAVPTMAYPIGQLTTQTAYVGGNPYTLQSAGYNVFGESTGETITIPATEGQLGGSYAYTHVYSPTIGLPMNTTMPAAGPLPAETVGTGYSTSLDLPATLTSLMGTAQQELTHNVTYTAYGQVAQEQVGSDSVYALLTDAYDPHTGALTDQQVTNRAVSDTPIDDTSYTYDPAGNPTSQTDNRQGVNAETQCFQYDPLDRLTQAWTATDHCAATPTGTSHATVGDGISAGTYWTTWQYNPDSTRNQQVDHTLTSGVADTVTSYTYGGTAAGCAAAGGPHTLTSTSTGNAADATSYCYDKAGDTVQRNTPAHGQQTLSWTDDGQLQAVTDASSGSSYIYGPDGHLLLQKDPGTNTLYLPGQQLAMDTTSKAVTATRFYQLPGGGQAVRTGTDGNYRFEITDPHNTSTLTLDSNLTNPVWRQQTLFGAPRGTAPVTWPDNHGFLGASQDTATGLTDVGARWYDPVTGRFVSLDPVLETASPQQLNGYAYAAQNPVTNSDPTGLLANPTMDGGDADTCTQLSCQPPEVQQILAQDGVAYYAGPIKIAAKIVKNPVKLIQVFWAWQSRVPDSSVNLYQEVQQLDDLCQVEAKDYCSGEFDQQLKQLMNDMAGASYLAQSTTGQQVVNGGLEVALNILSPNRSDDTVPHGYSNNEAVEEAEYGAIKLFNGDTSCANSFAGGTLVKLADGDSERIDQIKVGDQIADNLPGVAAGTKDQKHTVTAVHVTYTDSDYTDVTVDTGHGQATITGTAHHPYWDATTRAWTDADGIRPGDGLQTADGRTVKVLAVRNYTATMVTYNLTVDSVHTYYVLAGTTPVLVHNEGDDDYNQAMKKALAWLDERGFKAEKTTIGKFGDIQGKPIGMQTADGKTGFRIEFDARSGAHINVWSGKEKGPHFTFDATEKTVTKLQGNFGCK